jgi:predicted ATPase/serine phosphatase RsbU (regulator of sigma subunit)
LQKKMREASDVTLFRGFRNTDRTPVVVKVLSGEYPTAQDIARLKHEYSILKSFDSPGVVRTFGLERSGNGLALVLEDVGETSLDKFVGPRRVDIETFLKTAVAMAAVVNRIHARQIIHKDIKPQHFFRGRDPGDVTLIDFGLATRFSQKAQGTTSVPLLQGTLAYMSPEQTGRMNRLLDRRSDLYSLGVTLYELLTGVLPFQSADPLELVHSHIARAPLPPHTVRPEVPELLSQVVMRLLAKDPEERYQNAAGLKADLEACLTGLRADGSVVPFELGRNDLCDELRIPQRLYGRDAEVAELLAAFERTRRGAAQLLLITGTSGIGKSALVNEIQKGTLSGGYFVRGKFDQMGRSIPYAAIAAACGDLVRAVLTEPPRKLVAVKQRIAAALGPNGQLLVDLIPDLELLIGPQPEVPALGPRESQLRFELAFQSFVQAVACAQHPLCMFLDDLQWADAASLRLVHLMLTNPRRGHLLLVGAYRESEVEPGHPLARALGELRAAEAPLGEVRLGPLELAHVAELLGDMLGAGRERTLPLAALLLRKTLGSPFFLGQCLIALHKEGLLTLEAGVWRWDLDTIERATVTDNVVEFMVARLRRLAPGTQDVLRLAACIGHTFDVEILRRISPAPAAAIADGLWEAIREGLVLPVDARGSAPDSADADELDYDLRTICRFQHDRVQQAAYELIGAEERPALHLGIGRLLLARAGGVPDDEALFEIVNQMNVGAALIADPVEQRALAELNRLAGRKAKAAAAHRAAVALLETSLSLLGERAWDDDYELVTDVCLAKAECESLIGNSDEAFRLLALLARHARSVADRMRVAELKTVILTGVDRVEEAAACGVEAARLVGLSFPSERAAIAAAVRTDFPALRAELSARGIESVAALPVMTDPEARAAVSALFRSMPAVIQTDPNLLVLITLRVVELSLRRGNSPCSPYYYVAFGLGLGTVAGDMDAAYRLGQLGVSLAERLGDRIVAGASRLVFGGFISPWRDHLSVSVEHLRQGKRALLDSGDYSRLGYGVSYEITYRFLQGDNLDEIDAAIDEARALLQRTGDMVNVRQLELVRRAIADVRGQMGGGPPSQPDVAFDQIILGSGNRYLLCSRHVFRAITFYLGGDFEAAAAEAEAAAAIPVLGSFLIAEQCFYGALALAGCLRATTDEAARARLLAALRESEERLRAWAAAGPANFAARHALVAAELAAITGAADDALDGYERAIALATESGAVHHQAIAADLGARFHLERGRERLARVYQADARYSYGRWGAAPELDEVRADGGVRRTTTTSASSSKSEQIDILTVMRASQAISTEIVLPKLLATLMRIVIEQAGAEIGHLLLVRDGELWVEAAAGGESGGPWQRIRFDGEPAGAVADLAPRSVIAYAQRTRKTVLLASAQRGHIFSADPYFAARRPRSVLCVPMLRGGQLVGLLYLENSLTAQAFTAGRVSILEVLAAQAAISIENAMLYEQAEARAHLERELAIAQEIQTSILPSRMELPGFELSGHMATATEVGGDYYDLVPTDDGGFWIGIGDVSGHGLDAGLMMLMIQSGVSSLVRRDPDGDPAALLTLLNRMLYENVRRRLGRDDYATLSLLRFRSDGRFAVAGAHEVILVWRARAATCERIPTPGTWVGGKPDVSGDTVTHVHRLEPGDVMLLYTDGITEARNGSKEQFGIGRLADALAELAREPAPTVCARLFERLDGWAAPRGDDQSAIVIRYRG